MKKLRAYFLFVLFLAFGFCYFSANAYATEQAYLSEEPTVTIDRDARTIKIELSFQNLRSGMKELGYKIYNSDDDADPLMYFTFTGCTMGGMSSCEMQRLEAATITINETGVPDDRVYTATDFSFRDSLSDQMVSIDGELKFSLNDGIISNTIAIAPSTDVAAGRTYLAEEPNPEINEDENTFSLPLSIVNREDGIKSARIYLTYLPSSGPMLISHKRIDATRDCSDEASCQAEYKKPLTLEISDGRANNGRHLTQKLIIEYADGSMREIGGSLDLSRSAELTNTLDLSLAPPIPANVAFYIDGDIPDGVDTPENGTYYWDAYGNNNIPIPASTDNQIFSGWYTDEKLTNRLSDQMPDDDLNLYGKYINLDHDILDNEDTFNEWCNYENSVLICADPDNNSASTDNTSDPITPQVPSGIAMDGTSGEWISDNPNVVTVDQDGRVTGISESTANIRFVIYDDEGNIIYEYVLPYTVKNADNPNTFDSLPIAVVITIFSTIGLSGFALKSAIKRR